MLSGIDRPLFWNTVGIQQYCLEYCWNTTIVSRLAGATSQVTVTVIGEEAEVEPPTLVVYNGCELQECR